MLSKDSPKIFQNNMPGNVCFGCGTFQLNEQIEGLVNKILEGRGNKEILSTEINKGKNQGILYRIKKGDVLVIIYTFSLWINSIVIFIHYFYKK